MEKTKKQEQIPQSNPISQNNDAQQMGTLTSQSSAQIVQDVTASVNTQKQVNPQNPFIIPVPEQWEQKEACEPLQYGHLS